MTVEKRFVLKQDIVEENITEFETNGLDDLMIKKGK